MSINKIECYDGRLTLHGDYVVYHQDGVQFELHGDGIPGFLKGSRKGNIFVSTNRVIFAPTVQTDLGSFAMNFRSIRGVEVKQPMFGANYIKGDVISEPEGGWQGRGTFNITFNSGGAIEFAEHFRKAVVTGNRPGSQPMPAAGQQTFGIYNNPTPPQQPGYYNGPPYQAPYPPPQPGYYGVPPPQPGYYGAPDGGYYAAQPPPYRPPENPPPYPGQSGPTATPSAPPPNFPGAGGAKAQEAYSSGQNVYVPANQPPPPPYSAEQKKNV